MEEIYGSIGSMSGIKDHVACHIYNFHKLTLRGSAKCRSKAMR